MILISTLRGLQCHTEEPKSFINDRAKIVFII